MTVRISLEKMKNCSFLIKTVVEPDICLQHGGAEELPISTQLTEGDFSCSLYYRVDPQSPSQITVTLTSVTSLSAVEVILLDATPNLEMIKNESTHIPSTNNGGEMMEKKGEFWEVTLDMKRKFCLKCYQSQQSLIRMVTAPVSSVPPASNSQYHFPSHNLYLHLKSYTDKGNSVILKHVASLLDNETSADIEFHVNGTKLVAHSLIVSAGSPVLAAMFQNDFQEKSKRIATINDTTVEVFQQFLRYLYTGDVLENKKDAIVPDLFALADKYGVDSLKDECAVYMAEQLSVENAVDTLIAAHLHSSTILYEETVSFISRNMLTVCSCADWLSFMKEYPELCFVVNKSIIEVNYTSVL